MVISRGATRYPANCPAPCPAGAIILPATLQPATLTMHLVSPQTVHIERINQLDLKVSKTFRLGRVSVLPPWRSSTSQLGRDRHYLSTNILSQPYLGRHHHAAAMVGVGATVRW